MSRGGPTARLVVGVVITIIAIGCGSVSPAGSPSPSAAGGATETPVAATSPDGSASSPEAASSATATPTQVAATPTVSPQASSYGVWPLPANAALPDATAKALQAKLSELIVGSSVKGAAAAVLTPTGRWAGAVGVDAAKAAVKPTSTFGIGSVTKTATAAEVLLLASQGKLDIDAPVTKYVTLPFDAHGATIRQLATMKSGFPARSDQEMNQGIAKDLGRVWSAADVVTWAKDGAPLGTLGGAGVYNGINSKS